MMKITTLLIKIFDNVKCSNARKYFIRAKNHHDYFSIKPTLYLVLWPLRQAVKDEITSHFISDWSVKNTSVFILKRSRKLEEENNLLYSNNVHIL